MDYLLYWFMLPFSVVVATTATLGGIGGAAMFIPIFLIVFPILGPEYALAGPVAAIGVALLTQSFGFSSALIGYLRRRLIDFQTAKSFVIIGVPTAIVGALMSHSVDPTMLKLAYAILMLFLTYFLLRKPKLEKMHRISTEALSGDLHKGVERKIITKDGSVYKFHVLHLGKGSYATGIGGFITGLMSVGMGEVVMTQLVKICRVPVPVAAATSVLIVTVTIMLASLTHVLSLISEGGLNAVPWHLVMYTIPGVVIGGQIGTRLQGHISSEKMEKLIVVLFALIGISMIWIVVGDLYYDQ